MAEEFMGALTDAVDRSVERVDSGDMSEPKVPEIPESLRERIIGILRSDDIRFNPGEDSEGASARIAANIARVLWPERDFEIKKEMARLGLEREALLRYIKDTIKGEDLSAD